MFSKAYLKKYNSTKFVLFYVLYINNRVSD